MLTGILIMKRLATVFLLCATTCLPGAIADEADSRIDQLIRQMKDPDDSVRIKAAHALGRLGPKAKAAVPALIETLNDKKPRYTVRVAAAQALAEIGPDAEAAIPALIDILNDKQDPDADCYNAPRVLGKIGKAAVPHLIEALKAKNSELRIGAASDSGT